MTVPRRLLVISFHYPPDGAIGGMRWAGLTKYLHPHGWDSWVLTAAPAASSNGSVVVHCPRRTTLNDLYRSVRLRNQAPAGSGPNASKGSLLARLRLEAGMLFSLPDPGRGWVMRAAAAARQLIGQLTPDAVVSTGPPHSAHLVALLALRGLRMRWLVDLRDPWAGPKTMAWRASPWERSALARLTNGGLERMVVGSASGVVCNTSQFALAMQARYPGLPVHWIPNAVDHELLPSPTAPVDPFPGLSLAYAGTLYGGRGLRPVLQALRAFLNRHPEQKGERCRLRIAGHIDGPHRVELGREIEEFGLKENVELLGVLPRDAALRLAARSRLGIVLAQEQELQVPAKLYELAGMGLPTLVIAPQRSAAWTEAKRIGALSVEPDNTEALVQLMERLGNGGIPRQAAAEDVDYRDLAPKMAELLCPT